MKLALHLSIAILALLTACAVPSAPTTVSNAPSLTIVINDGVGRTLSPEIDMQPATFSVSGIGPGGASFFQEITSGLLTVDSLAAGDWAIIVSAQNGAGDLIGQGHAEATVTSSSTNVVSVAVRPIVGEGTLALSATWDPFHHSQVSFEATLTPAFGAEVPLTLTVGEDPVAQTGEVALAAGYYTLTLWLLEGGQRVNGVVEIVRIVAGQKTSGRYAFSNETNAQDPAMQLNIDVDLQNPLNVAVNGVASAGLNTDVTMTAAVTGYQENVMYFWYLNGALKATGNSFVFAGSPSYGSFNIDLVAYAADGTRAGSTRRVLEIENANALQNLSGVFTKSQSGSSGALTGVQVDALGNIVAVGTINAGDWSFGGGVGVSTSRPSFVIVKFNAQGQALWARALASSTLSATGSDLAIDSEGNIVVAGSLTGTGTAGIGGSVFVTGANYCSVPMLLKFSAAGEAVWAKTVDDHQTSFNTAPAYESVAIGSGDAIFVTGSLPGNTVSDFGNGVTLSSTTLPGLVVAKYSAAGDASWARSAAASSGDAFAFGNGIAADALGHIFVVGRAACQTLMGQLDFGSGVAAALNQATPTAFAALYDTQGVAQWVRTTSWSSGSSPPNTTFQRATTDASGNLYAAGSVSGSASFSFGTDSSGRPVDLDWRGGSGGNRAPLLVKYEASGTPLWARTMSVSNSTASAFSTVAVDGSGDVYAAGSYSGSEDAFFPFRFGNGISAQRSSASGSLLVKYSKEGVPVGATSEGGTDSPQFAALALAPGNSPVLVGSALNSLLLARY